MKVSLPVARTLRDAERMIGQGGEAALDLEITGLKPGARFEVETLDKEHGNAVAAWEAMSSPEPPTRRQTERLKLRAMALGLEAIQANRFGQLSLRGAVGRWSVILVDETD